MSLFLRDQALIALKMIAVLIGCLSEDSQSRMEGKGPVQQATSSLQFAVFDSFRLSTFWIVLLTMIRHEMIDFVTGLMKCPDG